jgi:hypothetical protein
MPTCVSTRFANSQSKSHLNVVQQVFLDDGQVSSGGMSQPEVGEASGGGPDMYASMASNGERWTGTKESEH